MIRFLSVMLLAVALGSGFGNASAELISTSENGIEVELLVEVTDSADSVVAHLAFEDEKPLVLPLLQRDNGFFGIRTELKPLNYQVIFELLGPDPQSSDPHSLLELGLELPTGSTLVTTTSTGDAEAISGDTRQWGWLAVAFAAAALSALAFWALGGEDRSRKEIDETGDDDIDPIPQRRTIEDEESE